MNTTHRPDSQQSDERKPRPPQRDDDKQHADHHKHGQPQQPRRHEQDHGAGHKK